MVISKTPLRISIAGGGTDLPYWYNKRGSMFISGAINKYIYITYHRSLFDPKVRARYSIMEEVDSVKEIKNEILKHTLKYCGIKDRVEITSHADVPSGTGLGSSGSFGVGVLHALTGGTYRSLQLAEIATKIQMKDCKFPIGVQDQYVAAFGGVNIYKTTQRDKGYFKVKKLVFDVGTFQDKLVMFFTGIKRDSNEILKNSTKSGLDRIQDIANESLEVLHDGNFDRYGELLNEHWEFKKKRGDMTSPEIDEYYHKGLELGAIGGKLIGAGGGGFLLFYTNNRKKLIDNMPLQHMPFRFVNDGSKIIEQ